MEPEQSPYEPLFGTTEHSSRTNLITNKNAGDSAANAVIPAGKADSVSVPPFKERESELGKQPSLLHQSSSYFKQATSGLMRWQSRRAFWSAVDPKDQPSGVRAAGGSTMSSTAFWFKTVREVARRHPSVIIAPLLLAAACIAGGLAGVIVSAQNEQESARANTATVAWQAASALELQLDVNALQPAAALAAAAAQQPSMGTLTVALPALMSRLLPPSTTRTPVRQVVLAPFGTVNASYVPPGGSGAGASPPGSGTFPVGSSVLMLGGAALSTAVQQQLAVVATTMVSGAATSAGAASSEVLLLVYQPVFVAGVAANETWGNVMSGDFSSGLCGGAMAGSCYNTSSGTKLWGFVCTVVSFSALAGAPESGLQGLANGGYQYSLSVQGAANPSTDWVVVAVSSPRPSMRRNTAVAAVQLAGPRQGAAVAPASEAELAVDHDDGWQVSWEGPLIAVVIIVSFALAAFLFVMLFNYWRHMSMLQALLPGKVINVLGTGSNYYQNFECVTVLYADVVRYTTEKPHQGEDMPTLEVVKLLNDVHSMYESIIDKYGLVRIRRSGESFLCVGGCPTPDDPVAVAMRVASCARDLVLSTSRFRGAGGFRVQIRVGLHSGPAVAAVVGSKMPRFSLFGDVVDVAYYMEATSRVMGIHLSEKTSQLLAAAKDPLLQLVPRGRLDIIGQGSMHTSWLKLDQLPETPPAAEEAAGEAEEGSGAAPKEDGKPL